MAAPMFWAPPVTITMRGVLTLASGIPRAIRHDGTALHAELVDADFHHVTHVKVLGRLHAIAHALVAYRSS
jgi:hypothetical protein